MEEINKEKIEEQEPEEKEPEKEFRWIGPVKIILALFFIFLLLLWVVPKYSIKLNPEPRYIPSIEEVIPTGNMAGNENETMIRASSSNEILKLMKPDDVFVKRTADKVISLSGCNTNKVCQAKAIYYFVRDRFNYVSDPYRYEYIKSAKESLMTKSGDCDDASVLLANLLEAIGIDTRFAFIPGHVFVQAWIPEAPRTYKFERDWINLDATCDNCRFGEIPYTNYKKEIRYLG